MFNNKLETLRTNLIKTLNNSDLEIGAAYYVLKDVCAGSYPNSHEAALKVMDQLQFDVIESKDVEF